MGVSYFDGMASSMRVKNLFDPLKLRNDITINNLIYNNDNHLLKEDKGRINDVTYQIISLTNFPYLSFIAKGIKYIKHNKSSDNKNIIYNYQYIDIKNIVFLLYAKLIGFKIILDIVEDNRYYVKFPSLKNKFKILSSLFFLKLTPFLSDYIITISNHLRELMQLTCREKVPVYLIPISVDLKRFKPTEYTIPKIFHIFYGGSFAQKDGVKYLIEAFAKVNEKASNVRLILTGRPSESDLVELEGLIADSPFKHRIIYKGFLKDDEYFQLLNSSDLFCMTRVNSNFSNAGFPFKLGEFLSTGKGVIATEIGDINKYLISGKNSLLIKPESSTELSDAILFFLNDPKQILIYGTAARKVAETNFNSELLSKKLYDIFYNI